MQTLPFRWSGRPLHDCMYLVLSPRGLWQLLMYAMGLVLGDLFSIPPVADWVTFLLFTVRRPVRTCLAASLTVVPRTDAVQAHGLGSGPAISGRMHVLLLFFLLFLLLVPDDMRYLLRNHDGQYNVFDYPLVASSFWELVVQVWILFLCYCFSHFYCYGCWFLMAARA